VQERKSVAKRALEDGKFDIASTAYTQAIVAANEAISNDPTNTCNFTEELYKLHSNRSLVYSKTKNLKAALIDADCCIQLNPTWTKVS